MPEAETLGKNVEKFWLNLYATMVPLFIFLEKVEVLEVGGGM